MAWNSYELTPGDEVVTPQGKGIIQKVSANGYVQVKINGQLIEVPNGDAAKTGDAKPDLKDVFKEAGNKEGGDVPQEANANESQADEFKVGDKVTEKATGKEGEVVQVTQRSIYVKFDNEQGRTNYRKQTAQDKLEKTGEGEEPKKKEAPKTPEQQAHDVADDMYGLFNLKKKLEDKIEAEVDGELKELREQVKKNQRLEVKVGDKVNVVTGRKHRQLETLITYGGLRLNSLMVGMAGTGKTHASEQVAEALGLPFYTISVGAQTSKSDIIGYMDASGKYVKTHFRDAYEKGGVFLMDEIDAGNANVLIQVNAALSNGYMSFPDEMVRKHKDFVFIASANTYGNGANRQYVGRNQLDAATLDRFSIIDWLIDEDLEKQLAVGRYGDAWHEAVRACRQFVADKNIRALISPRATQKGSQLLAAGVNVDEVISSVLLGSVPEDKKADVIQVAVTVYNRRASGVPSEIKEDIEKVNIEELPF